MKHTVYFNIATYFPDEFFRESDIINEVYLKSGMEERKRKNGCFVECILKRLGMVCLLHILLYNLHTLQLHT